MSDCRVPSMDQTPLHSQSQRHTQDLAEEFAIQLQPGDVVALVGDLGAGKTEFVRGVCRHFQVQDIVTSPTFAIINHYDGQLAGGSPVTIYHVDLYRIDTPEQLRSVGFEEMVHAPNAIKFIEWPEKASHEMPERHWTVTLRNDASDDNARLIEITAPERQMITDY
ncbi:MAG: tRNA (adenosine(37)-N6)-threonylcarbamoyltransferase complex ATPase subunit type 1 TsaE [Candidatus Kapabacteria bacterium]|nr:tRNA (adenosine(37)-N6)-threonylcarbamoyltransferase complex ATPase subunit type 1 TsaE [Candidatus Kapabacteria bacterium]